MSFKEYLRYKAIMGLLTLVQYVERRTRWMDDEPRR